MDREPTPPADAPIETQKCRDNGDESDDLFAAAAAAAGVPVPSIYTTRTRRWTALAVVTLAGAFSCGPLASWPTLEPLLIRQHVFEGPDQVDQLSQLFSIASGMGMIGYVFWGILFDALGGRVVAVVGSWGCAASLLCMGLSIKITSLNWLLWISYPAPVCFGNLSSFGGYGWYWLLPEHQNSVSAIFGSVQILADSFVMLAVWLHSQLGVSVDYYFMMLAGFSTLAGVMAAFLVPSLDEQLAYSAAVVAYMHKPANVDAHYGSCEGKTSEQPRPEQGAGRSTLAAFKENLSATLTWSSRMFPFVTCLFITYNMTYYVWSWYPQIEMYPLYDGLMGSQTAKHLVTVWGSLQGVVGTLALLAFGRLMDLAGYIPAVASLIPLVILNTYLFSLHSSGLQVAAQVLLAFLANSNLVIMPRFALFYAPPELFGTIYGIVGAFQGVSQVIGTPLSKWMARALTRALSLTGGAIVYLVSIYFWCGLYVAAAAALLLYWWYHPLPAVGSVSMDDIWAVAAGDAEESGAADLETASKVGYAKTKCNVRGIPESQTACKSRFAPGEDETK